MRGMAAILISLDAIPSVFSENRVALFDYQWQRRSRAGGTLSLSRSQQANHEEKVLRLVLGSFSRNCLI